MRTSLGSSNPQKHSKSHSKNKIKTRIQHYSIEKKRKEKENELLISREKEHGGKENPSDERHEPHVCR